MATVEANLGPHVRLFSKTTLALAALLYLAACLTPATDIGCGFGSLDDSASKESPNLGLFHLLFGWVFYPSSLPAWSANFVFFAGLLRLQQGCPRSAAILGVLALALGLTTLTCFKNESKYLGYFLWQSSQAVLTAGSLTTWLRRRCAADPIA